MDSKTTIIIDALKKEYPDAACELNFKTPLQLIIATVLSAQTTDKKVNEVTREWFEKGLILEDFLEFNVEEIENQIKQLGLYRNKSKNLYKMFRQLKEEFDGKVPSEMKSLTSLAGVGRKTANVVMSNAYGVPAIAVDTHVQRVSNRIGLATAKDPLKTEKQLMEVIDRDIWTLTHHLIIFHGRRCCTARNPKCSACVVAEYCRDYNS